jgi:hypothetical protein
LDTISSRAALAKVERTEDGSRVSVFWDRKLQHVQPVAPRVTYFDHGGMTLAFCRHAVALVMLDREGRRGQPGERTHPSPATPFYLLARGETWSVNGKGVVTIKK